VSLLYIANRLCGGIIFVGNREKVSNIHDISDHYDQCDVNDRFGINDQYGVRDRVGINDRYVINDLPGVHDRCNVIVTFVEIDNAFYSMDISMTVGTTF
jgi:hypothetical protein